MTLMVIWMRSHRHMTWLVEVRRATSGDHDDHLGGGSGRQKRKIGCTGQVPRRRNMSTHEARRGNANTVCGNQSYKNQ
jgi:hypothetical protein